jgi:hypothetical protein
MARSFSLESKSGLIAAVMTQSQRAALAAIANQDRQTPSGVLRDLVDREARSRGLLKEHADAQRPT